MTLHNPATRMTTVTPPWDLSTYRIRRKFWKFFGASFQVFDGERVAVLMTNCLEMPVCILGAMAAHAYVAPMNPNYSDSELDSWARRIAQWRRRVEVFAYFNNDWSGYAPENALKLRASLGA